MERRTIWALLGILLLAAAAVFVALPHDGGVRLGNQVFEDINYHLGLDLQGGLRVLLEAALPEGQTVDADQMEAARQIIERRVNALGVSEPVIQRVGSNRILVELPGLEDPDQAVEAFGSTGLLEFVDAGATPLEAGQRINTSDQPAEEQDPSLPTFDTILTGAQLKPGSAVVFDPTTNQPIIQFAFEDGEPAQTLQEFTRENVGGYLAITVDKEVISAPVIRSELPGSGVIEGNFTIDEAEAIVLQLKYGALPVPLEVIENRTVGATLGTDSVEQSFIAGVIGLAAVALFMILYYR
ncbi:MAG: preprotein translocase subunit SecD, partial [Ardenticatenaceae bacterium]